MITPGAVPVLLPAHHRRVATSTMIKLTLPTPWTPSTQQTAGCKRSIGECRQSAWLRAVANQSPGAATQLALITRLRSSNSRSDHRVTERS